MVHGQTLDSRPFFSLHGGTFRLGDRLVFANTTWTFHTGQHWAVIGPNGSGKSLFADGLRGRLPLVHGQLHYHFSPPAGLSPEEAIGYVAFEERKRAVHGTVVQSRWNSLEEDDAVLVQDFLSFDRVMEINPFEMANPRAQARRAFLRRRRHFVRLLELQPLLERRLLALSNGERQRVEIASALCRPLRLLILDEPFAGLDVLMRQHLHSLLARLMATSLRVLLITTRPEDLPRQITHVMRLANCHVAAAGARAQVLPQASMAVRYSSGASPGSTATHARSSLSMNRGRKTDPSPPAFAPKLRRGKQPCPHRMGRGRRHPSSSGSRSHIREGERGLSKTQRRRSRRGSELFRLTNVTVRYGRNTILRQVSWTVQAGESWALLGPNGSGKSTLLSLLLGDNPQVYANDIVVLGQRRDEGKSVWELKSQIGWVSPELHVHFDTSIECFEAVGSGFHDTIGLFEPLSLRQQAAVRLWLKRLDLASLARSPLDALSAGTQRLVLLARALVKQPQLMILDEPCQGLDAGHRAKFIRTLETLLGRGGLTAIYVTHRKDEIPPSIKRALRLAHGRARREALR